MPRQVLADMAMAYYLSMRNGLQRKQPQSELRGRNQSNFASPRHGRRDASELQPGPIGRVKYQLG